MLHCICICEAAQRRIDFHLNCFENSGAFALLWSFGRFQLNVNFICAVFLIDESIETMYRPGYMINLKSNRRGLSKVKCGTDKSS